LNIIIKRKKAGNSVEEVELNTLLTTTAIDQTDYGLWEPILNWPDGSSIL
jgi:hypothetical protein